MDPAQDAPASGRAVGSGRASCAGKDEVAGTAPVAHSGDGASASLEGGREPCASSPSAAAASSPIVAECVKPAQVAAVSPDSPLTVFRGVGNVTAKRLSEVGVRRVLDLAGLQGPAMVDVAAHAKVRNLDDMVAAARSVCGSATGAHSPARSGGGLSRATTGDSLPNMGRLALSESKPGAASPSNSVDGHGVASPAARGAPTARSRPAQARPPRSQRLKLQLVEVLWGASGEPLVVDPGRTDDVSRAYVDIDYGTRRVHLHLVGAADDDTDGGASVAGAGAGGAGAGATRPHGGCTLPFRALASLDVLDDTLQLGVKYGAKEKVAFERPPRPDAPRPRRTGSGSRGKRTPGSRAGGRTPGNGSGKTTTFAIPGGDGSAGVGGGGSAAAGASSGASVASGGSGASSAGPKKTGSGGKKNGRKVGSGGKKGRRKGSGALDLRGRVLALRFKTQKKCKEVAMRIRSALPKLKGAGFRGEGPMRCTYSLRGLRTLGRGANARVVVATVVHVPSPDDPPTEDEDDSASSSSDSGSEAYPASGVSTPATAHSVGSPHSVGGAGGSGSAPFFATPTGRSATPTVGGAAAAMGRMLEGVKRGQQSGASPDSPISILKGIGRVSVESLSRFGVRRVLDLARLDSGEVQDLASKAKVKGLLPAAASARLVCNATGKSLRGESRRRSSSQSGSSGMRRGGSSNSAASAASPASSARGDSPSAFSAEPPTMSAAPHRAPDARVPALLTGPAARGVDARSPGTILGAAPRDSRAPPALTSDARARSPATLVGATLRDARAPPALASNARAPGMLTSAACQPQNAPAPPSRAGDTGVGAVAPPSVPPAAGGGSAAPATGDAVAAGDSAAKPPMSPGTLAVAAQQGAADAARAAAAAAADAALASAVTLPAPPRASVSLGTKVAVKMFEKFTSSRAKVELTSVRAEAALQMRFSHPNLVQVLDVAEDSSRFYIVMERLNGGELYNMLEQRAMEDSAFSEYEACMVLRQVASALNVLHDLNIAHRDIKPENVMLRKPWCLDDVVLVDFGESKELNSRGRARTLRGSLGYMAPEISTGAGHYSGRAADVFSLGVTLFCMLCAKPPFGWDQSYDHVDATGPLWEDLTPECRNLVLAMLDRDASKRPSVKQVLEHPWLEMAMLVSDGEDGSDDGSEGDLDEDDDEDDDEDAL